jgi:predicted ABC-type ATPase
VKLNILRIEQRVALGGHNIPKADVIRRFGKSIKNFWNLLPIVDEWKLYYNGETNYEFVADNLAVLNDELYNKFKKGLK